MRETEVGSRVRRGLLRRGFDRRYVRRIAQELEEHWRDLVSEGVRQGLSEAEAEARASANIGTAEPLIEEFSSRMQRSSWLGRHPTLGFALLGLVGTVLWWAALIAPVGSAAGIFTWGKPVTNPLSNEALSACLNWIRWTSFFGPPWIICYTARRLHCGWKAALWGCLVLGIHNAMHSFVFSADSPGHGTMSWGYTFNFGTGPACLPLLAPVLVFGIDLLWNQRPEHRMSAKKNPL